VSDQPKLRRLLPRRQIQPWLETITGIDANLRMAIVEPNGRVFAQSSQWDNNNLANFIGTVQDNEANNSSRHFQNAINYNETTLGFLFVEGPEETLAENVTEFVRQALLMLIKEAGENRGLAVETLDRYRELNLLYRVGETIGAEVEPSKIAAMILEEGQQIIDADFGLVLLIDTNAGWDIMAQFGDQITTLELSGLFEQLPDDAASITQPSIMTEFTNPMFAGIGLSVQSLLWAPLSTSEKILGGVLLGRSSERPLFIANDQKLLVALASQAAVALDKANLFEETKASAHHLQELIAIGRDLAVLLDLDSLLQRILRAAVDLTKCLEGALFMVEEPSKDLVFTLIEGTKKDIVGMRLPFGTGIVGQVAKTGQPQIVDDTQGNRYWFDGIDKLKDTKTRSILAVPMIKQDQTIGVLEVINRRDGKPFSQQDMNRLTALASQAVVAIETCRLHEAELTKQRMERELQLGHTMQSSLIPSAVPDFSDWEFAALWEPAREVSGDFYDFIELDDGLGVVIADVADKGVQAALFMILTRSTVRTCLHALDSPAESIEEANRLIAQDASGGMFVTLAYTHIRPDSGEITYVNAGHNPPLWYQDESNRFAELDTTGVFLGYESDIPYEEKTIHCAPGDFIVFYTDGVTEAMNASRELFSEERFRSELQKVSELSPDEMLNSVLQALAEFVEETPQSDDITLVIAKRK
jgi:sigma-B regulation protein RsbU (phosphoserine phosphatase)